MTYVLQIIKRLLKVRPTMQSVNKVELNPYFVQLKKILKNYSCSYPLGLTPIFNFLYLGGTVEATDISLLKKHKITHVINCASNYVDTGQKFYKDSIKRYVSFAAEDEEDYNMMQHFEEAFDVIEEARLKGESVLIHCIMGVNRSALLTVAYVMIHDQCSPVTATEKVFKARRHILSNEGFRWQLLDFAKQRNMLEQP